MSQPEPKPYLLEITPYAQGKAKAKEASAQPPIKLSSNENPLGPSPQAIAAFRTMGDLHRYPDGSAAELRSAIAKVHGVNADCLICGAGSDELINLLVQAYAGPGDEVLYSEHGFLMYKIYTLSHGATPVTAPETELTADVDALLAKVTDKTKLVFLANPNNPTGTYLLTREVERLRAGLPDHVVLVLDAAYAEYVDEADYECGKALVESTSNTVMLRTFSKIYGLPSLRLGWAYAPASVIDALSRIRSPFNVNSAALRAGVAAVEDTEYTAYVARYNAKERARLGEALEHLGLRVTPSAGNFLLVHFPENGHTASSANKHLLEHHIIPREVGNYGFPHALRITVGTEEENSAVIDALREFMA